MLRQYRIERKKYTDRLRGERIRKAATQNDAAIEYSGDQSPLLCMLEVVRNNPTHVGHSFSTRKLVQLRMVEEALQVSKHVVFQSSDRKVTEAVGIHLHCRAVLSESKGWVVTKLSLNTRGDGLSSFEAKKQKQSTPLRTEWLVDILAPVFAEKPNTSNDTMRELLKVSCFLIINNFTYQIVTSSNQF